MNSALVLFSGGQDSATCLAWTLREFAEVQTIGFEYGQSHKIEMQARKHVLAIYSEMYPNLGKDQVFSTDILARIGGSTLLTGDKTATGTNGLPSSFVPGRNLFFLTCAAAYAYKEGICNLVTGVCETDYSGYPDCRDQAIKAVNLAINLCMDVEFKIYTPLMHLSKAQTWHLAHELGGNKLVEMIRIQTHTCYHGERVLLHEWGYGCGECPACQLRANGWQQYAATCKDG